MEEVQKNRKLLLFEGIIFTLLGFLAVAIPGITTLGTELFIGWLLIFTGAVQFYNALKNRLSPGFIGSLLMSFLYFIFGILLLAFPIAGVVSLAALLTFFFVIEGIVKIILGIQMRPFRHWGWLILNGILALVIAYIIWIGWPATAFWVMGMLVGINMIFFGISLITLALAIPKTTI